MKKITMNKKLVLFGSLSILTIGACMVTNVSSQEGVYRTRNSISQENTGSIEGAFDIYNKLRGEYTQEDWLRARMEADAMPQDRATFDWLDQGPDNVGGITRAILVDRADYNHLWAGSVGGGLFESFSRASEWQRVTTFEDNLGVSSMCQLPNGVLYVATGHQREITGGTQNSGHNGNGLYERQSDGTFTQIAGTASYSWINEVVCDTLNNRIWLATNSGLKRYVHGSGTVESITNGIPSTYSCNALAISTDGSVIVAGAATGKTFVSTDGGGSFIEYSSSSNTSAPIASGAGRVEYAISHEKGTNGKYYVYASCANTHLVGIWRSTDNGVTWAQIAPAGNGGPGTFSPFSHSTTSGQGTYDNIISVQRGNPDRIFLGGIDCYTWANNGNWTQISQWFLPIQSSQYVHADNHEMVWDKLGRLYVGNDGGISFSDDGGDSFVPANRGYNVTQFYSVGYSAHGDVIGGAQDNGTQANYHDNATYRSHDEVGGGDGFSAAISFINRNILFTSVYNGGIRRSSDRGANSNSFVPSEWTCPAGDSEGGCGQFYTNFELWENPKDLNSTDSIDYIPQANYSAGATVLVPSKTSTKLISYITPTSLVFDDTLDFNPGLTLLDTMITTVAPSTSYNLEILNYMFVPAFGSHPITAGDSIYFIDLDTTVAVLSYTTINHYYGTNPARPGKVYDMGNDDQVYNVGWDTIRVQDYYQSWFAIGLGGSGTSTNANPKGIWMTRNALRLSSPSNEWFKVADGTFAAAVSVMEFSHDGNHLFIGTWSGQLLRLSGFGQVYSPKKVDGGGFLADTLIDWDKGHYATTFTSIGSFGVPVTGIGVDNDPDHVVVTLGSFSAGSKVRESTNATGGAPTFTSISGNLSTTTPIPMYSVVVDRDDPNVIIIGGEFGTYYTENGGTTWTDCSGAFGKTPVFDMGQNWRTYNEGCIKPGQIYIGTHGRGIWSSDAYLSLPGDQDNLAPNKFIPNINVYPNPLSDVGNLQFSIEENSDVYLQIFNLSGQLVDEVSQSNMTAGNNTLTFDTNSLPKGTYIIRLTAGSMVETTKFIKR